MENDDFTPNTNKYTCKSFEEHSPSALKMDVLIKEESSV